ncbi:MAG: cation:proton antiporter [Pirellula sp.]|jgi:CPA2 family monovalent cation:H+ antiporter-2|nr:cation:proton antiporter [Pirellula sp.]
MHDTDLLMTIAIGLGGALLFGYATQRLGLSPIVGYLIAGIVVGPNTPGYTADAEIANQFAELGVILLMFGVGLHFDVQELSRVRNLCVPGAGFQCLCTFLIGLFTARLCGWEWTSSAVFALAIAFSSTVVVTRILADANELQTHVGNIAIGWLIVQDVLAVLVLVLLPYMTPNEQGEQVNLAWVATVAIAKIGVVAVAITWLGGRLIPSILKRVAATKSRELFTLTILVLVLAIALASSRMFGISMALGAFLAGVVVGQSEFSLRAAIDALPMRDAFAVLFFVSIGMLFDPIVFTQSKGMLLATTCIVILGTPFFCILGLLALGQPLRLSLRVGLSLSQIGEFSFIVANLGRQLGLLPDEAMHVLVTVSIVSIAAAPMMQWLAVPIADFARQRCRAYVLEVHRRPFTLQPAERSESTSEELEADHRAVIIGYGPVGRTLARILSENGISPTIIELNHNTLATIRQDGYSGVLGDATHPQTLLHAGIENCASLILSASSIQGAEELIRVAREINPEINILVRSTYLREREHLLRVGADTVFAGEGETAMALAEHVLRELGATPDQIDRERERLRSEIFVD